MTQTRRAAIALFSACLAAPALAQSLRKSRNIAGRYRAQGRNPDGSAYSGTVRIEQEGEAVAFAWNVGSTYTGTGFVEGQVVTVDWGSDTPVIYVIMDDGELHGTWADGRALEKLTPQ